MIMCINAVLGLKRYLDMVPVPLQVLEAGHLGSWADRVFVHLPDGDDSKDQA